MKPKLAILGESSLTTCIVDTAREMEVKTIFLDSQNFPFDAETDYDLSSTNTENLLAICKKEKINGVISNGCLSNFQKGNFLAAKLGLPNNSESCYHLLTDRYKLIKTLQSEGINTPIIHNLAYIKNLKSVNQDFVIRKLLSTTETFTQLYTQQKLQEIITNENALDDFNSCLIEEYIKGREICITTISSKRKHHVVLIMDQHRESISNFPKIAIHYPAILTAETENDIVDISKQILSILDIENGAFDLHFKITDNNDLVFINIKPFLKNSRAIFDMIKYSFGYNYIKTIINGAFGHLELPSIPKHEYAGVYFLNKSTEYMRDLFINPERYKQIIHSESNTNTPPQTRNDRYVVYKSKTRFNFERLDSNQKRGYQQYIPANSGKEKPHIKLISPYTPPLEEFIPMLKDIWDRNWLTNFGYYHEQLENALREYLNVPFLSLFSSGTVPLMLALKRFNITGEVITSPYGFVATTNSILWNGATPVFVDIDPKTCNLNPALIEKAITPNTQAILPVHLYGTPCDVKEIQKIADKYNLKVIYDGAHAFGVKENGKSILNEGDLATISFHATKVYNTIEGGAVICHDLQTKLWMDNMKNYGVLNDTTVIGEGINGKMDEVRAAYGLLNLKTINQVIAYRKEVADILTNEIENIEGLSILPNNENILRNYSYFPIFIDNKIYHSSREDLYHKFLDNNIMVRRYFYPLLSSYSLYQRFPSAEKGNLPIANKIAEQVLCLPIHHNLIPKDIERIIAILKAQ